MIALERRCRRCGLSYSAAHFGLHARVCEAALVCVCLTARPRPGWAGECDHCLRPVIALAGPLLREAALRAYPQLTLQPVDWTLRQRAA
jgi:hypothetical protein